MDAEKKRRIITWALIAAAAMAAVAIAGTITIVVAARNFVQGDQIAENVTIAGVDVGGMTSPEALERLHIRWVPTLPEEVTLRYADGEVAISPEELGVQLRLKEAVARAYRVGREGSLVEHVRGFIAMRNQGVNIPVRCEIDEMSLRKVLVALTEDVNRSPKDADIRVEGDDVTVIPGVIGRALDVGESQTVLAQTLADPYASEVDLVVKTEKPAITEENLSHFETVLAKYHTPFNPNRTDRTHNLRLAMSIINETVLEPGEEFSMNQHVGPRLTENGYRAAPIFLRGEVVPSTGGGVCQVASTLYNAALLANLDITERQHHSRPVDYTPAGRDATVYYGQLDLRFKNTLKHPILILGYIEGSNLHAKIIGAKEDDYEVELVTSGVSSFDYSTKEQDDPELEEGEREVETEGRRGTKATLTRIVKKDGKIIDRQVLHHDVYAAQTEIVRVGTKKPEDEQAAKKPEDGDSGGLAPADTGNGHPDPADTDDDRDEDDSE